MSGWEQFHSNLPSLVFLLCKLIFWQLYNKLQKLKGSQRSSYNIFDWLATENVNSSIDST